MDTEKTKASHLRGFLLVGAPRFELGTSSPPDWRANQAAPRPVLAHHTGLRRVLLFGK